MRALFTSFLAVVVLFIVACSKGSEPDPIVKEEAPVEEPETLVPDLRVMTYNIRLGNPPSAGAKRDLPAIARVINNAKPDLVALQEVDKNTVRSGITVNQAKELGKLTNMHAYFVGAMEVLGGGEYGEAILSKYPLLDSAGYALQADPSIGGEMRKMAVVKVALPDGSKVVFAGTHLDHKSEDNRLYQIDRLRRVLQQEKYPVILAGDFNALPSSLTINRLDEYFTRTCKHNCSPTFTAANPKSAIDFIMYRKKDKVAVVSSKVIFESYASDHLPVVAELKLN
ncbi:endonuclease/exonuclease/phosphatase family protein [Pontibacter harenae]|uniref:endonuclease/exonuclease/phosphatase family protein n=1 Tax=Pontibacter harenae TaxID=2894083 RepID=UPI001E5A7AC5|nr:endonuclease/exonuclease/phosphatase family protein [Pontibacter harenae]MCC9168436.1 endonuclease/exonuclease/phosphatase family protein [Pontibacter harenae]